MPFFPQHGAILPQIAESSRHKRHRCLQPFEKSFATNSLLPGESDSAGDVAAIGSIC